MPAALRYFWSRADTADPPNGRCDTNILRSEDLKRYSPLRRGHLTPHMRQCNSSTKKPGRQVHLVYVTEQKGVTDLHASFN